MDEEHPATAAERALVEDGARFRIETVQGPRLLIYHYTRAELEEMLEHYGETDEMIIRIEPEVKAD